MNPMIYLASYIIVFAVCVSDDWSKRQNETEKDEKSAEKRDIQQHR